MQIQNKFTKIEFFDPTFLDQIFFHSRYSYCGYIKQIIDMRTGKNFLDRPTKEFKPFDGEGFPDEFECPIGYDEANIGDCFIKIGVGIQKKISTNMYTNWDQHPIVTKFPVEVVKNDNVLIFKQRGDLNKRYAYDYEKIVEFCDSNRFLIKHKLLNTGSVTWRTLWYSHAFLPLENSIGGTIIELTSNSIIKKVPRFLKSANGGFTYQVSKNVDSECINWEIDHRTLNRQSIIDLNLGYHYLAEGDYGYNELQVYVNNYIISPEPKVQIEIAPGNKFEWSTKYSFTDIDEKDNVNEF